MALFRDARPSIIAAINTANSINLKIQDVVFQPAEPVSGITPPPTTAKNTRTILVAAPTAPFTSQVPVFYDRLSLAAVFAHTPINTYAKLRSFRPARIHDLIPDLNNYYGLELTPADIEDGALSLVDGIGDALIKAKPTSMTWTGEFTVSVIPGDLNLEKQLTVTDLTGIQYPSGQSEKGQAEAYSYYFDCSAYGTYLDALEVVAPGGEPVNQGFVDFVAELTGDPWVLEGDVPFSLEGAKITYNGLNSLNKPSNSNYDFICEVVVGSACQNFAGTLRFHYNLAVSVDTVAQNRSLNVNVEVMATYSPLNSTDPAYSPDRYNPYLATAYNDYSPQANALKTIPWQASTTAATNANATAIANALKAVDGLGWNMTASAPALEYNLFNVWVMYNGPVANAPATIGGQVADYRDGFTNVMLLCPPFAQQPNLWSGVGVVYYNV